MVKLARTKVAPGRSAEGHAWVRCLAINVLEKLGMVGPQAAVAKALAEIAAEEEAPASVRSAAARALGSLNYAGATGLNPAQIASVLGRLAAEACRVELESFAERYKEDQGAVISRQGLKPQLNAVAIGLSGAEEQKTGIAGIATPAPQKAFVDGVVERVQAVYDLFDVRDLAEEDLAQRITAAGADLTEFLNKGPQAPEAGTPPVAGGGR
jgi:hypothetical protein